MVNELRKLVWKYVYLIHINIPTKISSHVVSIFGNCLMVCNIVIKVVDEEEIDCKKYLLIAHLYHLGQYVVCHITDLCSRVQQGPLQRTLNFFRCVNFLTKSMHFEFFLFQNAFISSKITKNGRAWYF